MQRINTVIAAALIVTSSASTRAEQAGGAVPSTPKMAARAVTVGNTPARLLPGTRGNILTTIHGNALNSTNGALANSMVRLRDARFGRIVDSQFTDRSGMFAFGTIDPGSYIVELMGQDQSVLAASQIISVNSGDTVTAINGYEIGTNYDKLLELYGKLKSAQSISVVVLRGGKSVTLDYAIR